MSDEIKLEQFVGEHEFSGCDMTGAGDANGIIFMLDGVAYRAEEDPSDGYRSYLGTLSVSTTPVRNQFAPIRVTGRMRDEVLELIDVASGKTVLEVGTDNADDYYPWFVGTFTPENMSVNSGR